MSDDAPRHTRTVVAPSSAAKLMVLIGVLIAVFAVYLAFSPLERTTRDGRPIQCGSAFKPPGALVKVTCGNANAQRQWQTGAVFASALVVAFGGVWVYGGSRRVESERPARVPSPEPVDGTL
jgi:hypothetical protein